MEIEIVAFEDQFQGDIDKLMNSIGVEYALDFPPSNNNTTIYTPDKYWVALSDKRAVGTIALCKMNNNAIVLKRMFLEKELRGKGVSKMLLSTLKNWAVENHISEIYLGTMDVFKRLKDFMRKTIL